MDQVFNWLFEKKGRFFLFLLLSSFFLRISSLYYTFLDIDESQFAGFAHVLMDGGLPYRDSLDTKPPLIYLFYTICFFIFGTYSMWGVHLVTILWSLAVSIVLYKIAKENGYEKSGFFAALFYTIFSTAFIPKLIAANITSIMVLPLVLSVYFWLRGGRQLQLKDDFIAGVFVGIAFLFKYQAGIQLAVFFLFLIPIFKFQKGEKQITVYRYLSLMGGFLSPIVLTAGIIFTLGIWNDFIQWSFLGSFKYIQAGRETIHFFENLALRGGAFVLSTFLIWYLSAKAIIIFKKNPSPYPFLLIIWFGLTLIPVCIGGRFYGHYFIQILPPLCLMAGIAATELTSKRHFKIVGTLILIPAFFFWMIRIDQKTIYQMFPDDQLFEQKAIGEWIQENTDEKDTMFVWGFATAIYFHAQRKPVSRFLWTDLLVGKVPGSEKSNEPFFDTSTYASSLAWEALWEDFAKNPPTYFVDTQPANIHNYGKYPVIQYPQLFRYVQKNYRFWKNVGGCLIYKKRR